MRDVNMFGTFNFSSQFHSRDSPFVSEQFDWDIMLQFVAWLHLNTSLSISPLDAHCPLERSAQHCTFIGTRATVWAANRCRAALCCIWSQRMSCIAIWRLASEGMTISLHGHRCSAPSFPATAAHQQNFLLVCTNCMRSSLPGAMPSLIYLHCIKRAMLRTCRQTVAPHGVTIQIVGRRVCLGERQLR